MKVARKKQLERAGWAVGDAGEFLELSAEETRYVDMKLALAVGVREMRLKRGLTQTDLASRLKSSQSRVAKMEAGDSSVSMDLLVRSLLNIGASAAEIAKWIKNAA